MDISDDCKLKRFDSKTGNTIDKNKLVDGILTSDGKLFENRQRNHSVAISETSKSISSKWVDSLPTNADNVIKYIQNNVDHLLASSNSTTQRTLQLNGNPSTNSNLHLNKDNNEFNKFSINLQAEHMHITWDYENESCKYKPWTFLLKKIFEDTLLHMTTIQILRVTVVKQNIFKQHS